VSIYFGNLTGILLDFLNQKEFSYPKLKITSMSKFVSNFKWVMLICGLLTCSMFLGLFSPEALLQLNFGEVPGSSPYENIIVRNWSALLGLTGIMLLYGAYKPAVRSYSLVIAGISKVIL
jgi:hypothetical protein